MVKKRSSIFCFFILFAGLIHARDVVIPLTADWKFRKYGTSDSWLPAAVPGTVHTDLLQNSIIPDPFIGTNNLNLGWVDETDWEYTLDFRVNDDLLKNRHIELIFDGLDTYADVYLNGALVLKADNMFRRWTIDCSKLLTQSENNIRIVFKSALVEVRRKSKNLHYTLPGGEWALVRKAPYHFGWDWGPRFVTVGIWKPVYLKIWEKASIKDIQVHTISVNKDKAALNAIISILSAEDLKTTVSISYGSKKISDIKVDLKKGENRIPIPFEIRSPKLWWCNGSGEQHLYKLDFTVKGSNLKISKAISYGIRTVNLVQESDSIGKSFLFKVNGVPVFMKGANIIPRHSFIPSASESDLRKLMKSAASSGVNMLRVWGGGVYEDDLFYHLCDSLGILVWQDFMFAGSMYPGDSAFLNNVKEEVIQQVSRLRNHPSIALWCGNNEVDEAWHNWGWQKQYNMSKADSAKIWQDYLNLFQKLIPDEISKEDSERPYWSSSPKNGWGRKQSMTEGDSHYWGIWWGFEPFSVYKTKVPRFMSEYGFQGFPNSKTVFSFSKDGIKPDSLELLAHQKHPVGYQTINKYSQQEGFYPKSLDENIYLSQVVQSIGYRTAIESHRLAKPRCMGTLYWQLNDCWPVVSWSSIDFYGRWKAVQYTIRNAYKPILISSQIIENRVEVRAVSDYQQPTDGLLKVFVYSLNGDILRGWEQQVTKKANTSELLFNEPYQFNSADSANIFVYAEFIAKSGEMFNSYFYPCKQGNLKLQNPNIKSETIEVANEKILILTCFKPAFYVKVSSATTNFDIDDNYFNMLPGKEYRIKVLQGDLDRIEIKSLFNFLNPNNNR